LCRSVTDQKSDFKTALSEACQRAKRRQIYLLPRIFARSRTDSSWRCRDCRAAHAVHAGNDIRADGTAFALYAIINGPAQPQTTYSSAVALSGRLIAKYRFWALRRK
jgi:hypothetical protein